MGRLLLVRHGQASFGADDYDVLSETGWEQARRLGAWLAGQDVVPTALVRGGMRRHRETLEAMAQAAGWPLDGAVVDAGWDEFDHLGVVARHPDLPSGELDRREFQRVFEQATARWTSGEGEYDETYAGFVTRVHDAMTRATASAGPGRSVVVVTSGGPIGAACARLADPEADDAGLARLWSRFSNATVNTSLTRVVIGATGPRLLTFNEHPHLGDELLTYR